MPRCERISFGRLDSHGSDRPLTVAEVAAGRGCPGGWCHQFT